MGSDCIGSRSLLIFLLIMQNPGSQIQCSLKQGNMKASNSKLPVF